jgi:hypothetical protein
LPSLGTDRFSSPTTSSVPSTEFGMMESKQL